MEKLSEIDIQQSLSLTLNYTLDQSLLATNLATIVEALKELQRKQDELTQQQADAANDKSLLDQLDELRRRLEKVENKDPAVPVERVVEKP